MNKGPVILLDCGHGKDTKGKRSPDGKFREYAWNRAVGARVIEMLTDLRIPVVTVAPEEYDVPLPERVRRVNTACLEYGTENCILVSIHSNAAGSGKEWCSAKGWSAYTCKGQTRSDEIAECFYDIFEEHFADRVIRKQMKDGDRDWEEDFYILIHSRCAAVLLENFFYDNREECEWLLREDTQDRIANAIGMSIYKYLSR